MKGGCACGDIRYELLASPMVVHACHCTWCQRETGAAFAVNAVVETANVRLLQGEPITILTPTASGRGQQIVRCPACHVAVWSHYPNTGPVGAFIRVGTLDPPHGIAPDVHIFTSTRQPWVALPDGARAFPEFYNPQEVWPAEIQRRWAVMKGLA